jgi:hypothetical protein
VTQRRARIHDVGAWVAEAQPRAANGTAGDFVGTSVALAEPVDAAGAIGPEGGLAPCGSIVDPPDVLVKRGSAMLFRRRGPRVGLVDCACLDSVDTKNDEDARQQVRSSESAATDRRSARCLGKRRTQCTRLVVWRLCNHTLIP